MRSTKTLVRKNGARENIPSKCDRINVEPGDVLHFNTWGGGGWGDPLKRDAEKVAADVRARAGHRERRAPLRRGHRRGRARRCASRPRSCAATWPRRAARPRCSIAASSRSTNCARAARRRRASSRRASRASGRHYKHCGRIGGGTMSTGARRRTGRELRPRRLSRLAGLGPQAGADPDRFRAGLLRADGAAVRRRGLPDRARLRRCGCARSRMNAGIPVDPDRGHLSQGRRRRRRLLPQGAAAVAAFVAGSATQRFADGLSPARRRISSSPSNIRAPSSARALSASLTAAGVDTLVITGRHDLGMRARDLRRQHEPRIHHDRRARGRRRPRPASARGQPLRHEREICRRRARKPRSPNISARARTGARRRRRFDRRAFKARRR